MPAAKAPKPRVKPPAEVAEFAHRAFSNGFTVAEVRRAAGIHASTWMRWVRGTTTPTPEILSKLNRALTDLINQGT